METGETSSSATGAGYGNSTLPWHLIPAFKPGITDLTEYSRKMQFLSQMWPQEHLSQLAPRAALLCEGSAFQKLIRLDAAKLKTNDMKGVELLVNTLGGVWGKTVLENKYERFEKVIYATNQRSDETNESYLARHEILFEDVLSQGATFADMRSYILLRNSGLSAEDKKKVIVDSGGTLDYTKVTSSIRMLGSRFFQDVQGIAKSSQRTKTYDVNHVHEMDDETTTAGEEAYLGTVDNSDNIESFLDAYIADGDEDAILMAQFEDQLIDTIQGSEEMSAYMTSYVEARKRLLEKSKYRGFWPIGKGKSMGKGRGKGKNRKPLSQRIAESDCRRCLQRGHWKAECPVPADQLAAVRQKNQQRAQQHVANTMMPENIEEDMDDVLFSLPEDFQDYDQEVANHEANVVEAGIVSIAMAPKMSTTLADRFKKVRDQEKEEDTLARLNAMSMQQLQELPIRFGQAKLGTPFHEVVHNDPGYCQWFLGLYGESKNPKHMEFVHYLRLYIERMELENAESANEEEKPSGTKEPPKGVKLAMPKNKATPSVASWQEIEMEEQEERMILQHRMDQMENVLSQIVQQLQHLTVQNQSQVYCSAESQLTKQCIKGGSYAIRFGLSQGDLSHFENRCKLYDLIVKHRPRNIWMSPKCKAWNKWSQFNASRSTETALKIMQAREDDLVHLLLCAAIFELQTHRGPSYHFHLEQPVGSDMLYEEPLRVILDNALLARCDMCVAGKLTHPESKRLMQKGTQIITTSPIVHRAVQQWRCQHNHEHDHVAGSYVTNQGHREAVSKYSELYTHTFAKKILRAFDASKSIQEHRQTPIQWDVNAGEDIEAEAPSQKRRRLEEKQPRPAEFPEPTSLPRDTVPSPELTIDHLISEGQKIAPRVGKIVLEGGDFFHTVQRMFPQYQVRVIEISKGIDRFRKCPVNVRRGEAPYRRSFGTMRNGQVFDNQQWEDWENWSNRKVTSKCEPMRMMITVFAKGIESSRTSNKREHPIRENEEESAKKKKVTEKDEALREFEKELFPEQDVEGKNGEELTETKHVEHGEKFRALSKEEQQWIRKIHKNLGHPGASKLMNVLKGQDVDSRLIDAIPDFHCSTCHELSQPRRARPATLPEDREFNDCIGCDLIVWTNKHGKQFKCIHFIDAATNFHQAVQVHQTDALSLFEGFRQAWLHWAGPCKQMIIDNESGLCSEQFSNLAQSEDIQLRPIAAYAHWQLGKTERHGDILQHMLQKFDHEKDILHDTEFATALDHCCAAKNSLARHKGYTPEILVLGKSRKLPATNSSDHPDAAHYLAASDSPEGVAFRQQLAKRELARRAFVEMDNHDRLRRATLRKHCPHRGHHQSGVRVMFWKPGQGESVGRWVGPAQVIVQESNTVVWLSHVSRVYRVPPEHVRLLSEREAQNYLRSETQEDQKLPEISKSGIFQYEDLTGENVIPADEGGTPNPEEVPIAATPSNGSHQGGVQPDSEPLCSPSVGDFNGTESDIGSPSTPPESFVPETAVPDPSAIPIPDSEVDDELFAEDYWVVRDDHAFKVHNKPRTGPFQPHLDPDCPIDILSLKSERVSLMRKPSSKSIEQKIDRWDNYDHSEGREEEWIGVTVFHVITTKEEEEQAYQCTEEVLTVRQDQYWECEILLNNQDIQHLRKSEVDATAFLVSSAKKQRAEVKLKDLTVEQKREFDKAKEKEVDQWLSTGTVRAILRDRIPAANILRSRWILTWKDVDEIEEQEIGKSKKAKARLVILGYEDPNLTEIPRDSPTLQKESRSLILQYSASQQWWIRSFDIKTAFLRGSRRDDRILGVDPPEELRRKLGLKPLEICELLKSAYGLVNAP
eukprot:symbB.v1.2.028601.t2/scaffold3045.1/size120917/6